MISIGLDLVPAPDVSIEPEYFSFGSYTIGGIMKLTLSGTHHAKDTENYNEMIKAVIDINGLCRTIYTYGCTDTPLVQFNGVVGYVDSVDITAGDDVLNFSYSITMIVTHKTDRKPFIEREYDIPGIPSEINGQVIVNKYSRRESANLDNLNTFAAVFPASPQRDNPYDIVYGSAQVPDLTPIAGKLTVESEIGFYKADHCDSGSSLDIRSVVGDVLQSVGPYKHIDLPDKYDNEEHQIRYMLINESFKISQLGGSVTKEYALVPQECKAIVTMNFKEQTNQKSGQTKRTISGTITAVKAFNEAIIVYDKFRYVTFEGIEKIINSTCGTVGKGPGTLYGDIDTCLTLSSARRTENEAQKSINFEFTYEDMEKCLSKGYQVSTEYTETQGVKKVAEYLIPGKSESVVFISEGTTASRYKLRVSAKHNVCNPGEQFVKDLQEAVDAEFGMQAALLGLVGGNVLSLSTRKTTGRSSYSLEREYILCEDE